MRALPLSSLASRAFAPCLLVGALSPLAACEVSRPEGAYDASTRVIEGAADLDADVPFVPVADGGTAVPGFQPPTMVVTTADGAVVVTGPDGGTVPLDPELVRLVGLTGRYYMRMDIFSEAVIDSAPVSAALPTRVSYMYLVELGIDNSGLVAAERLCWQSFVHDCKSSSSCTATSSVVPASYAPLWSLPPQQRTYGVDGLELSASETTLPIGYTPTPDNSALPKAVTDSRVWDSPSGGSREGFQVVASYDQGFLISADCNLSTVQQLTTSFTGKLAGGEASPSFDDAIRFTVDRSKSNGEELAVTGCSAGNGSDSSQGTTGASYVRFAPVDENDVPAGAGFFNDACPSIGLWDSALPGDAP